MRRRTLMGVLVGFVLAFSACTGYTVYLLANYDTIKLPGTSIEIRTRPTATPSPTPEPTSTPRARPTPIPRATPPPNTALSVQVQEPFARRDGGFQVNYQIRNDSNWEADSLVVVASLTDTRTKTEINEENEYGRRLAPGSAWEGGLVVPIAGSDLWSAWAEWRWRDPATGRLSDWQKRSGVPLRPAR